MPTRIEVNLATGETTEIELVGEELVAYQASLAQQQAEVAQQSAEVTQGAPNGSNN